jgi:hypothetical protein
MLPMIFQSEPKLSNRYVIHPYSVLMHIYTIAQFMSATTCPLDCRQVKTQVGNESSVKFLA